MLILQGEIWCRSLLKLKGITRGVWPSRGGSVRKGYLFQAAGMWKRRNFSSGGTWQSREIAHFRLQKGPKELTDAFYGCERAEKTFGSCDLFIGSLWRGIQDKNVIGSYHKVHYIEFACILSYRTRYVVMSYSVMLYCNRNNVLSYLVTLYRNQNSIVSYSNDILKATDDILKAPYDSKLNIHLRFTIIIIYEVPNCTNWKAAHHIAYRIYSINRPGRLLNFWTLRVGAY